MQEPRSDEEIRRLIGEEGPSWRRTTDIRLFCFFADAACIAAILGAISIGILLDFSLLGLVIMALFLGLAYGVYKKNRLCAIVLFICGALLAASQLTGKIPGVLGYFPIGFLVALLLGIVGTFAINKRKKERNA
jgi:predicted branched-subunit amino acid permease